MPIAELRSVLLGYDPDIEAVLREMDSDPEMPLEFASSNQELVWVTDSDGAYEKLKEIRDEIYS